MIAAIQSTSDVRSYTDSANATSVRTASPDAFSSTLSAVTSKLTNVQDHPQGYAKDTHARKARVQANDSLPIAVGPQIVVPPVPQTVLMPVLSITGPEMAAVPTTTEVSGSNVAGFSMSATLAVDLPSSLPMELTQVDGAMMSIGPKDIGQTLFVMRDNVTDGVQDEALNVNVAAAPTQAVDSSKASGNQAEIRHLSGDTRDHEAVLRDAIVNAMKVEPSQDISSTQAKDSLPATTNSVPLPTTHVISVGSVAPSFVDAVSVQVTKPDQEPVSKNQLVMPTVSIVPLQVVKHQAPLSGDQLGMPTVSAIPVQLAKHQAPVLGDQLDMPTVSAAQVQVAKPDQTLASKDELVTPFLSALVVPQILSVGETLTKAGKLTPVVDVVGERANQPADPATTTRGNAVANLTAIGAPINTRAGMFVAPTLPAMPAPNVVSSPRVPKGMPVVRGTSPAVSTKTLSAPDIPGTRGHRNISAAEDVDANASDTGSGGEQNKGVVTSPVTDVATIPGSTATHVALMDVPAVAAANVSQSSVASPHATPVVPGAVIPAPLQHVAQAVTVAMPTVSSARLIQSIQQSDMRVGINSSEFGAISIHTSTSRGVISSEITLGHEELAKTINAHLSAMPDKAGTAQVTNVRLETSSPTLGGSGGSSHGSEDQKQQRGAGTRPTTSYSTSTQPSLEQSSPIAVHRQNTLSDRLDIHV